MSATYFGHANDGALTVSDDSGKSYTFAGFMGDASVTGLLPHGRQAAVGEVRGVVVSVRQGARALPEITINGACKRIVGDATEAKALMLGVASGFVSTVADIGDYAAVDIDFSYVGNTGDTTRHILAKDCIVTAFDFSEGDPLNMVAITLQCLGPMTLDGTAYISAR
jgi:hypothetical protein